MQKDRLSRANLLIPISSIFQEVSSTQMPDLYNFNYVHITSFFAFFHNSQEMTSTCCYLFFLKMGRVDDYIIASPYFFWNNAIDLNFMLFGCLFEILNPTFNVFLSSNVERKYLVCFSNDGFETIL